MSIQEYILAAISGSSGPPAWTASISGNLATLTIDNAYLTNLGWNGADNVELTSSATITDNVASQTQALKLAVTMPTGKVFTFINNGIIAGAGGYGGLGKNGTQSSQTNGIGGGQGGIGIKVLAACNIVNNGIIGGGGGGGSGAGSSYYAGGGGGGGGAGNGTPGNGGSKYGTGTVGTAGSAGTLLTGGNGGNGGSATGLAAAWGTAVAATNGDYTYTYPGGAAGYAGASGSGNGSNGGGGGGGGLGSTGGKGGGNSSTPTTGGAKGPAGISVAGNSFVTWITTGTICGAKA